MRTDAMLPLRGLQTLPTRAPTRVDGGRAGNGVTAQEDGEFARTLRGASESATVVEISSAAASLLESGLAAAQAPAQGAEPTPAIVTEAEEAFEPEIFGDDSDERVEDASRIGLNGSADDLADDVARYGAAEHFGKDGVFQVYGAEPADIGGDQKTPAELAQEERAEESTPGGELTADEQQMVAELRTRDAEVRSHESAHMAAGGGLTGGMSLSYQLGPDGKRYAVGGEVSIDASPGNTPEETVLKAQRVRAAALAPAEPSAQDRSVAARAGQMEADARGQLRLQRAAELRDTMRGLQPGEESDGFPPKTLTLGEVEGLEPEPKDNVVELQTAPPPVEVPEEPAVDPAVEAAIEPRGDAVDLMAIFEKITGGDDGVIEDAEVAGDETGRRLGGRLSGFEGGSAADAQLSGMTSSLETAYRAVQNPQAQAYDLVA
jgi:hypothetical protein